MFQCLGVYLNSTNLISLVVYLFTDHRVDSFSVPSVDYLRTGYLPMTDYYNGGSSQGPFNIFIVSTMDNTDVKLMLPSYMSSAATIVSASSSASVGQNLTLNLNRFQVAQVRHELSTYRLSVCV